MAYIKAFEQLRTFAASSYPDAKSLGITGAPPPPLRIGGLIPRDRNGKIKYENSWTPLQVKRAIAITFLALSILATIGFIATAVAAAIIPKARIPFALFFPGCATSGAGIIISYFISIALFAQRNLDSPKVRQEEITLLHTDKSWVKNFGSRYENGFDSVVSYALLKDAPEQTYKEGAKLVQEHRQLFRFCDQRENEIEDAYDRITLLTWMTLNSEKRKKARQEAEALYLKALNNLQEGKIREMNIRRLAFEQLLLPEAGQK